MSGVSEKELIAMVTELIRQTQTGMSGIAKTQTDQQVTIAKLEAAFSHNNVILSDFKQMYRETLEDHKAYREANDKRISTLAKELNTRVGDLEKVVTKNSMVGSIASRIGNIVMTAAGGAIIVWIITNIGKGA